MSKRPLIAAILALPLAACATVPPVEVTRFHIDNPARSGTLAVEEMPGNPDVSLEFRTYAAAVQQQFQQVGFSAVPAGASSDYVALVNFRRSFRPSGVDRSGKPVSVGVGGGIGSGGYSGLGVGVGINLSGKPKDIVTTELQVQLLRGLAGSAVRRAEGVQAPGRGEVQPARDARRAARMPGWTPARV